MDVSLMTRKVHEEYLSGVVVVGEFIAYISILIFLSLVENLYVLFNGSCLPCRLKVFYVQ